MTDLTPDEIRGTLDTWERAGYFYSLGEPPSRAAARAVDRRPRRLFWITAAGTACADAQVTTLRERLLKLAVWVERSVRRVVLHLPLACPWLPEWRRLARAVGARP